MKLFERKEWLGGVDELATIERTKADKDITSC